MASIPICFCIKEIPGTNSIAPFSLLKKGDSGAYNGQEREKILILLAGIYTLE